MTYPEYWLLVSFVAARTASFVAFLPLLKTRSIPVMAKAMIVVFLSMFVATNLEPMTVDSFWHFFGLLLVEVLIGFVLAYTVELLFSIVRVAGTLIDTDIGLANPFPDPTTNSQSTSISRMFFYILVLVFIVIGGFESVLYGFIHTFQFDINYLFFMETTFIKHMLEMFGFLFAGALQIALPFMMSTFIVYIALLLMTKSVDKINVLMNIFGVKILLGLVLVALSIPVLLMVFQQLNDQIIENFIKTVEIIFRKE